MEQPKYLIDTNAIIDYLGQKLPPVGMEWMSSIVDKVPVVSVITKIELLGFNAPPQHYQLLVDFIEDASVLDLSTQVVEKSIEIRRAHKTKLPDAIIAASAMIYNLTLISNNEKDFANIEGLNTVSPHKV